MFTDFIIYFDMLLSVGVEISIKREVFFYSFQPLYLVYNSLFFSQFA